MTTELRLRCQCGLLRGRLLDVSPKSGVRVTCYCDDCQAYAHHMGNPERVLDAWGGTDIFQTTPAQIALTAGPEHLRCLRLSPRGLMRWYAQCCRTPVANTLAAPRAAFAGVFAVFTDHSGDGLERERVMGPTVKVQARFARGGSPGGHGRATFGVIVRSLRVLGAGTVRRRAQPSPFFAPDGTPKVAPEILVGE